MLNQLQSQGYALTPPLLDRAACDDLIERVMVLGDVSAGTRRLLEQLVALRLQLDDSGGDAGPLKVVPGSHRAGRLSDAAIAGWREQHGEVICVVPRGAGLLLRPLLLHASAKATSGRPRRVLHFLFAPAQAGYGLQWNVPVRRAAIC